MKEQIPYTGMNGHIRVFPKHDPSQILFERKNVIVQTVKSLFARLMRNSGEPLHGVWGLALGIGDASWSPETQPDATATQTALFSQILRKPLTTANFVDSDFNPVNNTFTNIVDFQTEVNASTDALLGVGVREMGLIGGGTTGTDMLTAPFWDPTAPNANSVTLINYKTLPPLILPPGVTIIFSWVVVF